MRQREALFPIAPSYVLPKERGNPRGMMTVVQCPAHVREPQGIIGGYFAMAEPEATGGYFAAVEKVEGPYGL